MQTPKNAYHRENLEESLLKTAAEIISTQGLKGLSLRELGRAAGVSRTAAYHYFPDKAALMARVGEMGFARLGAAIVREIDTAADLETQMKQGLFAYLHFAQQEPHYFRLMFADKLIRDRDFAIEADATPLPFSSESAQKTFALLLNGIGALQKQGKIGGSDPIVVLNIWWAFTHGVAVLALDNHLKGRAAEQVLEKGLQSLMRQE